MPVLDLDPYGDSPTHPPAIAVPAMAIPRTNEEILALGDIDPGFAGVS